MIAGKPCACCPTTLFLVHIQNKFDDLSVCLVSMSSCNKLKKLFDPPRFFFFFTYVVWYDVIRLYHVNITAGDPNHRHLGGEPVKPSPEAPRSRFLGHLAPAWLAPGGKTALPRGEEDAQLRNKGVRTTAGHAAVTDRLLQLAGGECELREVVG